MNINPYTDTARQILVPASRAGAREKRILSRAEEFFYRAFMVSQNIQTDLGLPGANFFIALGLGKSGNVNSTNYDTAYGGALLWFKRGPVTVTTPAIKDNRYFSFILMDVNINQIHIVSKRTDPAAKAGGDFTVSNKAEDNPTYLMPSEICVLLCRVYGNVYDATDKDYVNDLIKLFKVNGNTVLHTIIPGPIGLVVTKSEDIPVDPRQFMSLVDEAIKFEPTKANKQLADYIQEVDAYAYGQSPFIYAQVQSAFTLAQSSINTWIVMPPTQWNLTSADDLPFPDNPAKSAAVIQRLSKYVNLKVEAQYSYNGRSTLGTRYNGDGDGYFMDLPDLPTTDGFWSITPYQEDGFIPDKAPGRYTVGTASNPVKIAALADRRILCFSKTKPTVPAAFPDSNWCQLPPGTVYFLARVYYPTGDVFHFPPMHMRPWA